MNQTDYSRIYAIGDIHGCADLLDIMAAEIRRDVRDTPTTRPLVVTLGDYIDRGPDSRGVLDRLVANPFDCEYRALRGNHEEFLLDFLDEPALGKNWRRVGGLETLASYRVPVQALMLGQELDQTAATLRDRLPDAHLRFLASLETSLMMPDHFLCHAGVRPGIALERQSPDDLLWIRREFLDSPVDFGRLVVHGHTPAEQPEIRRNRINVDTGAFMTGCLTCVVLDREEGGHRFLFARRR